MDDDEYQSMVTYYNRVADEMPCPVLDPLNSKCLQNQIVLCWGLAIQGLGRTNFYPKANIPL